MPSTTPPEDAPRPQTPLPPRGPATTTEAPTPGTSVPPATDPSGADTGADARPGAPLVITRHDQAAPEPPETQTAAPTDEPSAEGAATEDAPSSAAEDEGTGEGTGEVDADEDEAEAPDEASGPSARVRKNRRLLLGLLVGLVLVGALAYGGSALRVPAPAPRPTPAPTPYATAPTLPPAVLFADDFSSDQAGWALGANTADKGLAVIEQGALVLSEETPRTSTSLVVPGRAPYSNFVLRVEVAQTGGTTSDAFYLTFRSTRDERTGYALAVYPDQRYSLSLLRNGTLTPLVSLRHSALLKPGAQTNVIEIRAQDTVLTLSFNDQQAAQLSSYTVGSGEIHLGLSHNTSPPGLRVRFRNLFLTTAELSTLLPDTTPPLAPTPPAAQEVSSPSPSP